MNANLIKTRLLIIIITLKILATGQIDSAKGNLANTYVNAFVNIASGKDSLMLQRKEGDTAWIYKVSTI